MPVAITGMHRSATSMVAHLLADCGLFVGDHLMPPAPDNPDGFWEDTRFVGVNESLLQSLGGDWDDPPPGDVWSSREVPGELRSRAEELIGEFEDHGPWGWKDPRTCLTLPFWLELLGDLKLVVCLRSPLEVARSLQKRNHSSVLHGLRLWHAYNDRLLASTSPDQRLVTHYAAYLDDPRRELDRLVDFCDFEVGEDAIREALGVIKPGLRHSQAIGARKLAAEGVPPETVDLYSALCREAGWRDRRPAGATAPHPAAEQPLEPDPDRARLAEELGRLTMRTGELATGLASDAEEAQQEHERLLQRETQLTSGETPAIGGLAGPKLDPIATEETAKERLKGFLESGERLEFRRSRSPKVSVVVVSYKRPHLTYLALDSLLSSEHELDFEVVVVDNEGDDETRELLQRLENAQVRFNDDNVGFGPANMAGAELARGEYLCFLNNDAITTPGWLSSLTRVLDEQPDCAAVGSMLVGMDGALQEAGSIVWRDGSCRGYGRGDDPDGDEYSYRRDVDFCSAASLLVRREVFDAVGGFDERYAPAYYEDADLCLAIWEAGHRVAYEPASRVLHLEYGSSGGEAAMRRQLANREKFAAKWGSRLEGQLEPGSRNVLRARDRRPGKRVLIVDDKIPDPGLGSGFPRTRALIDALLAEGYVLTYLATADGRVSSPTRRELTERGVEVLAGRRSIADFLRARAHLYEAAIVSRPHNAHVIKSLKELNPDIRLLYDAEAVFALRDAMQRATAGQEVRQDEVDALVAEEIGLADGADAVVTVSERERSVFTRHCPLPSVIWGHAVRVRRSDVPFDDRDDLLLVGNFETPPNADALRTLMNEHLPAVRDEVPCRLYAVGALPHPNVVQAAEKQAEAVELTGFVPDLTEYYDRSRVFVAPHRFAGGIPLKVVEAMAHGLPCVMSELLGEQLGIRPGEHALVATARQPFAECVTRLYRDRDLWESIQRAGYEFIEANFNPDSMRGALIQAIEDPGSIAPADARANGQGAEPPAAVAGSGRAEVPG